VIFMIFMYIFFPILSVPLTVFNVVRLSRSSHPCKKVAIPALVIAGLLFLPGFRILVGGTCCIATKLFFWASIVTGACVLCKHACEYAEANGCCKRVSQDVAKRCCVKLVRKCGPCGPSNTNNNNNNNNNGSSNNNDPSCCPVNCCTTESKSKQSPSSNSNTNDTNDWDMMVDWDTNGLIPSVGAKRRQDPVNCCTNANVSVVPQNTTNVTTSSQQHASIYPDLPFVPPPPPTPTPLNNTNTNATTVDTKKTI